MRLIKRLLICFVCQQVLFVSAVIAATATTTFQVSASIANACNVGSTPMAFGPYNPFSGTPSQANATISVTCVTGTTYTVALNTGTTGSATFAQRLLTDGSSHTLNYNIYTTNAYSTVWGDGTGSTQLVPASGTITATGAAQTYTAYGQIPAGQAGSSRPAATYTDTITVTVDFT